MTWGVVASIGGSLLGGLFGGGSSGGGGASQQQAQVYDPYGPYRQAAAQKLNALMADPSSIQNLPEYQADMQAAERTMAAQGYTGSGNALVAAANAGGQAYQQAFNNLAMLSGAGQSPAMARQAADYAAYNQQGMQNGMWSQLGSNLGNWFGGNTGSYSSGSFGYGSGSIFPQYGGGGGKYSGGLAAG